MQVRDAGLNIQESGHGTPFVWGHGLMASIEAEDALDWFGWNHLSDSVRLIRYDARGHGSSSAARGADAYRWSNLGADMLAVADAMDAPSFIAGGFSMGCASAIHAAVQAPHRVRGLVLAMAPMVWEGRSAQRHMYQRIAQLGNQLDGRALARLMSRDMARTLPPWLIEARPGLAASMALGIRALDRRAMADMFHGAAMSDLPARAALAAIADVPALLLGWAGDATHPLSSVQELHRLLPKSELHVARCQYEFEAFGGRMQAFAASLG